LDPVAITSTDLFSLLALNLFSLLVLGAEGERSAVKIPIFTAGSKPAVKACYHHQSVTRASSENEVINAGPCYGLTVKINYHCHRVITARP
jgi:hypothetical protein